MSRVKEQYEKWVYPLPAQDLDADFREGYFDLSDPSLFRRKFWPRPVEPHALKILIAGCGTMQAARIAYRNPACDVVGVDFSEPSLAHEAYLKEKHGLANLRLHCLGILDVETLGEQFDLIISTGVLHHLPDPDAGLRALKAVLLPHGVMSIMLYGWYRRFGVYMMQDVFRLLGVEQTTAGVGIVRETLAALPAWHHVQSFVRSTPDLDFDAGVVDIFLHPSDRAYSVAQVLKFATDNGLRFQDWLDRRLYSLTAHVPPTLASYAPAARMPVEQQWQFVELLRQSTGLHSFVLCHPERDPCDYALDFSDPAAADWLAYVPHLRPPTDVLIGPDTWVPYVPPLPPPIDLPISSSAVPEAPTTMRRHTHVFTLDGRETSMFKKVDGHRTIDGIVQAVSTTAAQRAENRDSAFRLFARMREWDHLLFEIGCR